MGFSSVPLRLNESTESPGEQAQANMTLYNTTRCLCGFDASVYDPYHYGDFTSVLLKTASLELAITLMFICTHKLGMNVTQESKTHLLSKLLTTRGNARQNKKLLVHCLIASDTRIRVAAVYLVRRDFFFGCSARSSSICFFITYDSSFSLSR